METEELVRLLAPPATVPETAAAVAELVTRYRSSAYRLALRVCGGNRTLADEVLQDTFVRIFTWLRDRGEKKPVTTFPVLLTTFVRRAAIDLVRRERQHARGPSGDASDVGEARWGHDAFEASDVPKLIVTLTQREREVILATYLEGLSAVEIGSRMGLTPSNVRMLRFRAMRALRRSAGVGPVDDVEGAS